MNNKWMPVTAGVLDILSGISVILFGCLQIMAGAGAFSGGDINDDYTKMGILLMAIGVLTIGCSVFAFKRNLWHLVMVVTITVLLIPTLLALLHYKIALIFIAVPVIVAIILTILSRKQFQQ